MIASSSPTFSCRGSISPSLPRNRKRKRKREGIKLRVEMSRSRPRDLWKEQEIANFFTDWDFSPPPKRIGVMIELGLFTIGMLVNPALPFDHSHTRSQKKEGRIILMGPFSPFPFSLDEKEGGSRVEGEIYIQRILPPQVSSRPSGKVVLVPPLLLSLRGRSRAASGRCHVKLC